MSLLQNEDYLIWQLRTSFLAHDRDGVGERLIKVEPPALFNDPGIRAAGLTDGLTVPRTHSPPIPVATAVASEYFKGPRRQARFAPEIEVEDDDDGGAVIGAGSSETVGPRPQVKRRRRREQQEEDDSSDLSDESEDEQESNNRAAQQIRFAKMPVRNRAGSSPIRHVSEQNNPELTVTEASKVESNGRTRRGSLGAVEAIKQRARRDTTTSSEMSSENELDPSVFKRRQVRPARGNSASSTAPSIEERDEYEEQVESKGLEDVKEADEDSDEAPDGSSLSSGFESPDTESLLGATDDRLSSASLADLIPPGLNIKNPDSPRKARLQSATTLQALPPPRPISTVIPISALGQAIRAKQKKPKDPVEGFAKYSGKGEPDTINLKIYAPSSELPSTPFEVILKRSVQVTVADAIGLCVWRYQEEGLKPTLEREKLDVNKWIMRMMDDDEVDYDFDALTRTANISKFTVNNNSSRAGRGRGRGKPFDAFGLVEATDEQYAQNQQETPQYTLKFEEANEEGEEDGAKSPSTIGLAPGADIVSMIPKPFASSSSRKGSIDLPPSQHHSTPRMGPPKLLKVHFTSLEAQHQTTTIEVSTDSYIAEVLDMVCKKWSLEKQHHYLKISGTNQVALLDRQVEALSNRVDLDLVRKRFAGEAAHGLATTPSSTPPNAPLLMAEGTTPNRRGRRANATGGLHPLAQKLDVWAEPSSTFRRYDVVRRTGNSFFKSSRCVMLLENDALIYMPADAGRTLFETSKAQGKSVSYKEIVHCKTSRSHPKNFKVTTLKPGTNGKSQKLYEFEAASEAESKEIITEILKRATNIPPTRWIDP